MKKKLSFMLFVAVMTIAMTSMIALAAGTKGTPGNNSNGTGLNILSKSVPGQMTHGNYKNNTNSCASCHMTHTAKADSLLFADKSVVCMECHNGTLGIYNVESHTSLGAGTMDDAGLSASNHNVGVDLDLSAAPGFDTLGATTGTNKFECSSCHNPHGSYSTRLLDANPGGDQARTFVTGGVAVGNKWSAVTIYNGSKAAPLTGVATSAVPGRFFNQVTGMLITPAAADGGKGAYSAGKDAIAAYITLNAASVATGSYYDKDVTGLAGTETILQFYKNQGGVYVPTAFAVTAVNTTSIKVNGGTVVSIANANVSKINNGKGYVIPSVDYASIDEVVLPLTVNFVLKPAASGDIVNGVAEMENNTAVNFTGTNANNVAYSEWCGSCHTNYFSSVKEASGTTGTYYHHTVNSSSNGRSCGYCHFAHGTDVNLMKDATGKTVADLIAVGGLYEGDTTAAENYMKDVNASSALKRFTNMTVCFGCHTSSHSEPLLERGQLPGQAGGLGANFQSSGTWQ